MIKVILEYTGTPADNAALVGKVLSAINGKEFKKLKRAGVVRTIIQRGERDEAS
jgi:hypothetical protein